MATAATLTAASALTLSSCSVDLPFGDDTELECSAPTSTALEVPSYGYFVSPTYFTTSGGLLRFDVHDLASTIFGEANGTTVYLGTEGDPPEVPDYVTPDPPDDAVLELEVELDRPGFVDLPAGRYWALTGSGRIDVAYCPDVAISYVEPGTRPSPR